jgi:hypothetical protein
MPPRSDRDDVDERGLVIKRAPVKPFIVSFKCRWTGDRYVFSYGKEKGE